MELEIRPFDPARDDLGELTRLIRRAYASLAAMGLRYVGTWQDEEVTASRIEGAECYLAFVDQQLVGTVTLHRYEEGIPFYERDDVASFGQLCVEPEWQGRGIGGRLVDLVEARARRVRRDVPPLEMQCLRQGIRGTATTGQVMPVRRPVGGSDSWNGNQNQGSQDRG